MEYSHHSSRHGVQGGSTGAPDDLNLTPIQGIPKAEVQVFHELRRRGAALNVPYVFVDGTLQAQYQHTPAVLPAPQWDASRSEGLTNPAWQQPTYSVCRPQTLGDVPMVPSVTQAYPAGSGNSVNGQYFAQGAALASPPPTYPANLPHPQAAQPNFAMPSGSAVQHSVAASSATLSSSQPCQSPGLYQPAPHSTPAPHQSSTQTSSSPPVAPPSSSPAAASYRLPAIPSFTPPSADSASSSAQHRVPTGSSATNYKVKDATAVRSAQDALEFSRTAVKSRDTFEAARSSPH